MRVAVQCPDDHPVSPGAVFAFRLGRIEDGVHNSLIHTGETIPLDEFTDALVKQAQVEYPDHIIRVERLVQKPDSPGESYWVPIEEFDPEKHTPVGAGNQLSTEVHVNAGQNGGN